MVLYARDGKWFFNNQLLSQIRNKEHDNVLLIIKGVDVKNLVDSAGMTLLHHAVKAGNEMTVKYLIEQGCEVDAVDDFGHTPLMHAMRRRHYSIISILLESNADMLIKDKDDENPLQLALADRFTPLHAAVFLKALERKCSTDKQQMARALLDAKCSLVQVMRFGDPILTGYMLDQGCNINDCDNENGFTALHYAVQNVDVDHVKLFIQRGASIGAKDESGWTASDHYRPGGENSYAMLIALLDHDTSLNASTAEGYKFAAKVLMSGLSNEVELLLNKHDFKLSGNSWNWNGETLLHAIANNINPGVMETLEGRQFDVNDRDTYGRTALWHAALACNPSGLEFFLKHGADPDSRSYMGSTVLFFSIEKSVTYNSSYDVDVKNNLHCVELLLEYGADVQCEDYVNRTVLDVIFDVNRFELNLPPSLALAVAQIAMIEALGQQVKTNILEKLANNKYYKDFFALCKREIEKLRETMINETVSLFQFLTESEDKLLLYLRNRESAEKLEKLISEMQNPDILFIKRLKKRVQSILETAKLREKASLNIARMSECSNQDVIERIILFLDKESLQNLCQVYSAI